MFRHRIKDLMIANAVLAISLGIAITLGQYLLQVGLILGMILATVVAPVAWVETYLYRKRQGLWYRSMNPRKPRPRYRPMTDLPYFPPVSDEEEPSSKGRNRTRLFEKAARSRSISRASLLLDVASRFETSGSLDAAAMTYRQILDHFASKPEAQDAARRLQALSNKKATVDL